MGVLNACDRPHTQPMSTICGMVSTLRMVSSNFSTSWFTLLQMAAQR